MSWRFRKTFKVLPGVKLNLTARGLSATIGAAPFSVNVGPRGVYRNISIPGTGAWERERLDSPSQPAPDEQTPQRYGPHAPPQPLPPTPPAVADDSVTEIRSASTETLKSHSMADLQKLLEEAYAERTAIEQEIRVSAREADIASRRYLGWEKGLLLKRVFPKSFIARKEVFEMAQAKLDELREQQRLTTLSTQIEIDQQQAEPYDKMRESFAAMCGCQKVWDTLERRAIDRGLERSVADEAVTRDAVSPALGSCDLIQWEQKVPHLPNCKGGDLYIYPGFVLYRAAKRAFALVETREIRLSCVRQRFTERDQVPSDAEVVGHAWAKSNKDGSRDRRFRDNYQIPVVCYGSLRFTSRGGLQEEFLVSNAVLAQCFTSAWDTFQASCPAGEQHAASGEARGGAWEPPKKPAAQPPAFQAASGQPEVAAAFARESEKARTLALGHGEYWEFLLGAELLRSKLAQLESECGNLDRALRSAPRRRFSGIEFIRWQGGKIGEFTPLRGRLATAISVGLTSCWGRPGEPGDAIRILKAVDAVLDCCRAFLAWELEVCGAAPPDRLKGLGAAFRGVTMSVIGDIRGLPDALIRGTEGARRGLKESPINLTSALPTQFEKFQAEMREVEKHPEWFRG